MEKGQQIVPRQASKESWQQKRLVRPQEGSEQGSDVEANQEQKQGVVYSRMGHGSEELFSCLGHKRKENPGVDNPGKNLPLRVNQLFYKVRVDPDLPGDTNIVCVA